MAIWGFGPEVGSNSSKNSFGSFSRVYTHPSCVSKDLPHVKVDKPATITSVLV